MIVATPYLIVATAAAILFVAYALFDLRRERRRQHDFEQAVQDMHRLHPTVADMSREYRRWLDSLPEVRGR